MFEMSSINKALTPLLPSEQSVAGAFVTLLM